MLNTLRQELKELSAGLNRRDKIDSMLTSLRAEEQTLLQKEQTLHEMLSRENADVKRLERTSVTSLFYAALGRKETQLEKEQQEAYAAKLKYDAAVCLLDDCRQQMASLIREQDSLSDCERRYRQVYDEILKVLKDDREYAVDLCETEGKLGEAESQLREIKEAMNAGASCMDQIAYIEKSLDSAEGWGTWDLMGGGLFTDLAKHSHLDKAQSTAEQLQSLLSRFRTELADVKISAQMDPVNVDGFLLFADYFFDGLIADWCVLSRISDSKKSVTQIKSQLHTALSRLKLLYTRQEKEITERKQQLDGMVCGITSRLMAAPCLCVKQ